MTAIEKKQLIVEHLQGINDEAKLDKVFNLVVNGEEDIHYFTEAQHKALDEAQREIEAGNYYTHEEANKKMREWLKK